MFLKSLQFCSGNAKMYVYKIRRLISEMQSYKADEVFRAGEGICVKKERARDKSPHIHEFIELIYISSGEGTEIVGGVELTVRKGDLLFINFGESHAFSKSDMNFVNILIRPEFISEVLVNSENILDIFALPQFSSISGEFSRECIVSFSGDELVRMSEIVNTMLYEFEEKRSGYITLLHAYTQIVFTMLIRRLKGHCSYKEKIPSKILSYIDEHISEKLTLSDIAENCFYNPSYFSRKFKNVYGKRLVEYIKERRLDKAAEMLADGEYTVDAVIEAVAFPGKTHFYKEFRKRFSMTPNEYRKCKKTSTHM